MYHELRGILNISCLKVIHFFPYFIALTVSRCYCALKYSWTCLVLLPARLMNG